MKVRPYGPMPTAYLNVHCQLQLGFLPSGIILGASIHSSPAELVSLVWKQDRPEFWATVYKVEGTTFQHAKDELLRVVRESSRFRPLLVWLDESKEAHDARGVLQRLAAGKEP